MKKISLNPFIIYNFAQLRQNRSQLAESPLIKPAHTFSAISSQAYHPPLYYLYLAPFLRLGQFLKLNQIEVFYLLRLASGVFFFASIWLFHQIFRHYLQNEKARLALTLFWAINPHTLKMAVGINPDMALVFSVGLFFYVFLKTDHKRPRLPQIFIFSLLTALAALLKFSGIFLCAFFLISLFLNKDLNLKTRIKHGFFFIGFNILFLSPWLVFNWKRYGKFLPTNFALICGQIKPPPQLLAIPINAVLALRHSLMHFSGFMGWGTPHPFKWFFTLYSFATVVVLIFGFLALFKQKKQSAHHLLLITGSLIAFLVLLALKHQLNALNCDIQGRYLLPVWPLLGLCIYYGLQTVCGSRAKSVSRILFIWSLFHFFFIIFWVLIPRYYV